MPATRRIQNGSSPPARGTPLLRLLYATAARFIPARAGNTLQRSSAWRSWPVHPRPRGEHLSAVPLVSLPSGSSPPARGTHEALKRLLYGDRFIPARAGNTRPGFGGSFPRPVHPRPRGEHDRPTALLSERFGSSPPARGTPVRVHGANGRRRFIPARAGNTFVQTMSPRSSTVHPRPRGEHGRVSAS